MPLGVRHHWDSAAGVHAPLAVTSCRHGGVSRPPYATLNLGYHVQDDPEAVTENRRRFLASWEIPFDRLIVPRQTHTANVAALTPSDLASPPRLNDVDALITNCSEIAVGVLVADCVPVFLYDAETRAIGIAHAGWRGTIAGVVAETLKRMETEFGTSAGNCSAILGPSIGPCCYTVSDDLARRFQDRFGKAVADGTQLSLWDSLKVELMETGVCPERIAVSGLCTACQTDDFYSHRKEGGQTGRLLALLNLSRS
jgi:hypothetical protein